MRPGFSEFSYGYAVTEDIVRQRGTGAVPVFPSLADEGDRGYDLDKCPGAIIISSVQAKRLHGFKQGERSANPPS